jgi:predicted CXXCH cytochrome family protein
MRAGLAIAVLGALGLANTIANAAPESESVIGATPRAQRVARSSVREFSNGNCQQCHDFDELFSHPVGVVPPPEMTIPSGMPLTAGRMTCQTCHSDLNDNHVQEPSRSRGFRSPISARPDFCNQCHTSSGFTGPDMHAGATSRAHLPGSDRGPDRSSLPKFGSIGSLDAESTSCLSCHDGSIARDIGHVSEPAGRGGLMRTTSGNEHPIGMDYRLTDPQDSDGELRPAAMLDDRIRLFNNQVGCGSCHSLYSTKPSRLVMSNKQSRLCLSCHMY